jgi:hypothetical protein
MPTVSYDPSQQFEGWAVSAINNMAGAIALRRIRAHRRTGTSWRLRRCLPGPVTAFSRADGADFSSHTGPSRSCPAAETPDRLKTESREAADG